MILCGLWITESGSFRAPGTIQTAGGERTSVTLQDGSTVHLNTNTTISVELSDARRRVTLKKGEAWFSVGPDRTRPFDVEAGHGTTRAVGTEFNVRQDHDGATVTVIEGTVEVSQTDQPASADRAVHVKPVTVGEQIQYSRCTGIGHVSHADLVQVTGWRCGQLVFDLKPLAEVVTEVDGYWPGKILVMNSDLRRHRISGVFKTGDPDAVVHALETTFRMKSVKVAGYLIVLY